MLEALNSNINERIGKEVGRQAQNISSNKSDFDTELILDRFVTKDEF